MHTWQCTGYIGSKDLINWQSYPKECSYKETFKMNQKKTSFENASQNSHIGVKEMLGLQFIFQVSIHGDISCSEMCLRKTASILFISKWNVPLIGFMTSLGSLCKLIRMQMLRNPFLHWIWWEGNRNEMSAAIAKHLTRTIRGHPSIIIQMLKIKFCIFVPWIIFNPH